MRFALIIAGILIVSISVLNSSLKAQSNNPSTYGYIDGYLQNVTYKLEQDKKVSLFFYGGFDEIMMRRAFTSANGLLNYDQRRKSYTRILQDMAFQKELQPSNAMNLLNGESGIESTDAILGFFEGLSGTSSFATTLFEQIMTDFHPSIAYKMDDYVRMLQKLGTGGTVKHIPLEHIKAAANQLSTATDLLSLAGSVKDIAMNTMLLNAADIDLSIHRMEYLQSADIIDDNAYREALSIVIRDLKAFDTDIWKKMVVIIRDNKEELQSGALTLTQLLLSNTTQLSTPATGWVFAATFTYKTLKDIGEWNQTLRESALAATLYSRIRLSDHSTNPVMVDLAEYAALTFLDDMHECMDYFYMKTWEFIKPDQREIRIFFQEDMENYLERIAMRRAQKFCSTFNSKTNTQAERASRKGSIKRKNLLIGLILDSSGSMRGTDPNDVRKKGSKLIIDLLSGTEDVIIVDFDGSASWLNQDEHSAAEKATLKRHIDRIDSQGSTDIGAGLRTMKDACLYIGPHTKSAILLLSDGKSSYNQEAQWFHDNGIPIYTVSYKNNADIKLLQNIAHSTNGLYFGVNDEVELASIFTQFLVELKNESKLSSWQGKIDTKGEKQFKVNADRGMKSMVASCTHSGKGMQMVMVSPDGMQYTPANHGIIEPSYTITRVQKPTAGEWTIAIKNTSGGGGSSAYSLNVSGDSPIKLDLQNISNHPTVFNLKLTDKDAALKPNSITGNIAINYPGQRRDTIFNAFSQGLFSMPARMGVGVYSFHADVFAETLNGEKLQRHFVRSFAVGTGISPYTGPVQQVFGNILVCDLGRQNGAWEGIRCTIYSAKEPSKAIAQGVVFSLDEVQSRVRITNILATDRIAPNDIVKLDITDWRSDSPRN